MPSPFPGMDPYLEGHLWPDVHHALASQLRRQLIPYLRPKYIARIETLVVEDKKPQPEIGIMYPDVEILSTKQDRDAGELGEVAPVYEAEKPIIPTVSPAMYRFPIGMIELRLSRVEIRDTAHNRLVTSIEILSPVNKREPGLADYRKKRERYYEADVHLLELDLIRRGQRPLEDRRLEENAYIISLIRAKSGVADIWPIQLQDSLPVVPVPLIPPDPDVPLDLGLAVKAIYDEAAYDLSIDYDQAPPPPPLTDVERRWMEDILGDGDS